MRTFSCAADRPRIIFSLHGCLTKQPHMVSRYVRFAGLVCYVLMLAGAGCNRGPAMGKISGEVTMDGQPLKEGRILFTPEDGQGQTGGDTIKDGKFLVEV